MLKLRSQPKSGARSVVPAALPQMRDAYLWRKAGTPLWLQRHGVELLAKFPQRFAMIERPGRKRITLEIVFAHYRKAAQLVSAHGGTAKKISFARLKGNRPASDKTIKIGNRLLIGPRTRPIRRTSAGIPYLMIPAEAGFGTGEHATTAMSLRLLEKLTRGWPCGWAMLDAGSGSGILALAGRVFGAGKVSGIDTDPIAVATARRNARRNRMTGIRFRRGDATKLRGREKFDTIMANLYSELLIAALPAFEKSLTGARCLILSGVLRQQERELRRALRQHCFDIEKIRRRGKWIAILVRLRECRRRFTATSRQLAGAALHG